MPAVAISPPSAIAVTKPSPFLRDVLELSVGSAHVCALTTKHEVVCWGDNAAGQLGIGRDGRAAPSNLARPHVVGGLPPIAHVAAGTMHTCAIDREGAVLCWGSAGGDLVETRGGAAGSIELHGRALGTAVRIPLGAGAARVVALSNKGDVACVAFADDVRCWHTFRTIPIDATTIEQPNLSIFPIAGASALAMGHGAICAVARDQVSCWREDGTPRSVARSPGDRGVPARVSIGEMYACVASTTGELRCWWSLIGDFWKKPPNRDVRWPQKPATRAVAVGDSPICTADRDGRVDCFLADEVGLTDQAAARSWATTKLEPHAIDGIDGAVDLGVGSGRDVMGYGFGCALRGVPDASGAQVLCWGDNESGQLGHGDRESSLTAVRVVGSM